MSDFKRCAAAPEGTIPPPEVLAEIETLEQRLLTLKAEMRLLRRGGNLLDLAATLGAASGGAPAPAPALRGAAAASAAAKANRLAAQGIVAPPPVRAHKQAQMLARAHEHRHRCLHTLLLLVSPPPADSSITFVVVVATYGTLSAISRVRRAPPQWQCRCLQLALPPPHRAARRERRVTRHAHRS